MGPSTGRECSPGPWALALGADVACVKLLLWATQISPRMLPTTPPFPWVKVLPGQVEVKEHLRPLAGRESSHM